MVADKSHFLDVMYYIKSFADAKIEVLEINSVKREIYSWFLIHPMSFFIIFVWKYGDLHEGYHYDYWIKQ